jgi:hypothetical protein
LQRVLSPTHFVNVRTTHGGPAPQETSRAITESARLLERDRTQWQASREQLQRAEAELRTRAQAL